MEQNDISTPSVPPGLLTPTATTADSMEIDSYTQQLSQDSLVGNVRRLNLAPSKDEMLIQFIEDEIVQHFPWVSAYQAHQTQSGLQGIRYPQQWRDLKAIFQKLGYDTETADAWRVLSMAMLNSPEPSLIQINTRKETV